MSQSMKIAFALIGAFFALLFVAVAVTLQLALAGFEPPMDESYYRRGLDYQAHLNRLERGRAAGWKLEVDLPREPVTVGLLRLHFRLVGAVPDDEVPELDVRLERPASTRGRSMVSVRGKRNVGGALFSADLPVSAAGTWELHAEVRSNLTAVSRRIRFNAVGMPDRKNRGEKTAPRTP